MNIQGLPFQKESHAAAIKANNMTGAEFCALDYYLTICARCGKKENHFDHTEIDIAIFNEFIWARLPVPASSLCTACHLHFLRFKDAIYDCKDLIICSNYIERAIKCRKQFLKTTQKSKQQDSLERCLSTRQKAC